MASMSTQLDIRSRRALWGFGVRFSTFAAFAAGPCIAGVRSLREAGLGFHFLCFFGALFAFAWAALLRERPNGPSLNFWGEALALFAAGLLAKMLADLATA